MVFNHSFLGFLLYGTIAALYIVEYIYDTNLYKENRYAKIGFPFDQSYFGRLKFLTHIDVVCRLI